MQIDPIFLKTHPQVENVASVTPRKSLQASFLETAVARSSMRRMREESEMLSALREEEMETSPFEELIAQFIFALWEERYEDALQIVEQIPPFLPTDPFSDETEIFGLTSQFFLMKSKCYEKLGQLEKALEALDEGVELMERYGDFAEATGLKSHWALRKAALLGVLGKDEEAIATLRAYQLRSPEDVLLYHFLEQKLNVTLLLENRPIPIFPTKEDTNEEDANVIAWGDLDSNGDFISWFRGEALFMAGRYEEAERFLASKVGSGWGEPVDFLRASCLVMMGKYDEALAFREQSSEAEDREWDMIYLLCTGSLPRSWEFEDEFDIGFPLPLFLEWEFN